MIEPSSPSNSHCIETPIRDKSSESSPMHIQPENGLSNNNNNHQQKYAFPVGGSLVRFHSEDNGFAKEHHHHNAVDGVEILIMGSMANSQPAATPRKEDEQITSAVMKVLQGYQWSLIPTTTK